MRISENSIILLKGKIKNKDIESIFYDDLTNKYNVYFIAKNNQVQNKVYKYMATDVEILSDYVKLDISKYCFKVKDLYLSSIKKVYQYKNDNTSYFKIVFEKDVCKYYPESILSVTQNTLINNDCKNIFNYLKEIAHIITNNSSITLSLSNKYEEIQQIDNGSA